MSRVDEVLQPKNLSYFNVATGAYAFGKNRENPKYYENLRCQSHVGRILSNTLFTCFTIGLLACFGANEIFHNGQPALLYLDPSLVGSTLGCAAVNNQVADLWGFKEEDGEN